MISPNSSSSFTIRRRITAAEQMQFIELPFEVPEATEELQVVCSVAGAAFAGDSIDLGVRDAERVRGWSGGARDRFAIGWRQATPGYLPGPINAGPWAILVSSNRLPADGCTVEATITCVAPQPRWFNGDLHTHTDHSDGVYRLPEALALADDAGLEFVALTDHNTTSQNHAVPIDARLSVIPGMELTTYGGHANLLGVVEPLPDFRATDPAMVRARLAAARAAGATIVINHPFESDCAWQHGWDVPFDCVEVWNGPWRPSNQQALAWWQMQLARGQRTAAVCGSDVHRPHPYIRHGWPTAWVWSRSARPASLLEAIARGHVAMSFAPFGPLIDLRTETGQAGDVVACGMQALATIQRVAAGDRIRIISERGLEHEHIVASADEPWTYAWRTERRFYRIEVWRTFPQVGQTLAAALSNPLYVGAGWES